MPAEGTAGGVRPGGVPRRLRFCIARALGRRTRFLLADEISTMLDLITQSQIWSFLMEEAERRKIGLLAVSHSMPLLESVCTRICELEKMG